LFKVAKVVGKGIVVVGGIESVWYLEREKERERMQHEDLQKKRAWNLF
jgi:hypothetical protein